MLILLSYKQSFVTGLFILYAELTVSRNEGNIKHSTQVYTVFYESQWCERIRLCSTIRHV